MVCHWEDTDVAVQEMFSNVRPPAGFADTQESLIFVCVAFAVRVV